MSVRVWKKASLQRPERIWAFWKRIIWMCCLSKLRMMPAMTILNKCDNEFFFCFDQTYSVLYVLLFLLTRLSIFVSEVHIFFDILFSELELIQHLVSRIMNLLCFFALYGVYQFVYFILFFCIFLFSHLYKVSVDFFF